MTFKNGQVRRWYPVQATSDGTYELAGRGSYLAVELGSDDERILILEASGHARFISTASRTSVIPMPMVMSGCRSSFAKGRTRSCFRPDASVESPPGCVRDCFGHAQPWRPHRSRPRREQASERRGGDRGAQCFATLERRPGDREPAARWGAGAHEHSRAATTFGSQGRFPDHRPGASGSPRSCGEPDSSGPTEFPRDVARYHDAEVCASPARTGTQADLPQGAIDGSVQYYALLPARPQPGKAGEETKTPRRPGLA